MCWRYLQLIETYHSYNLCFNCSYNIIYIHDIFISLINPLINFSFLLIANVVRGLNFKLHTEICECDLHLSLQIASLNYRTLVYWMIISMSSNKRLACLTRLVKLIEFLIWFKCCMLHYECIVLYVLLINLLAFGTYSLG